MSATPLVYLARHGETPWSLSGQHTGLTDLALTPHGEEEAGSLGKRLEGITFSKVFTSPLRRAADTCRIAGFGNVAETDPDLVEWDYGEYEGTLRADILRRDPNWKIYRDGCPGGESPAQVAARANGVVARARAVQGNVLIFSSGHFLRVLAARWLALEPVHAGCFVLNTASLSILGYEHDLSEPVIRSWNAT